MRSLACVRYGRGCPSLNRFAYGKRGGNGFEFAIYGHDGLGVL